MPVRGYTRQQAFLLPVDPEDMLPPWHAARFIAEYVDQLEPEDWLELAIRPSGDDLGAPAYNPRMLLSTWLYGCLTKVVNLRPLEQACRESIPFMWISGYQRPDHNTLWRFYDRHKKQIRKIFRSTVQTGLAIGLFDPNVQALDGSKIAGNAARERTYNAEQLERLLERVNRLLDEMERQTREEVTPAQPRLPQALTNATVLREQIRAAQARIAAEGGPKHLNLTDPDATLMKGRQGFIAGFNAQAMVAPIPAERLGKPGLFITAVDVVMDPEDHGQLAPMIDAAREAGVTAKVTLADAGYHSGANLEACAERGQEILMPESAPDRVLEQPYHKDRFQHDSEDDTYRCPAGQVLRFTGTKQRSGKEPVRVYAAGAVCVTCPAFGTCTKSKQGRVLEIGPHDELLRQHRSLMRTEEAKLLYRLRKVLPEPVFGILKEQCGLRRFLVRGLEKARSWWTFTALGFNLRSLYLAWLRRPTDQPWRFARIAAG